jgi:hypothetical protein
MNDSQEKIVEANRIVWIIIVLLTAVVSFISHLFLFSLRLILIEFLLYPLALAVAALFTALAAVFFSNLLLGKEEHTPARPVVLACEGTAVALTILTSRPMMISVPCCMAIASMPGML